MNKYLMIFVRKQGSDIRISMFVSEAHCLSLLTIASFDSRHIKMKKRQKKICQKIIKIQGRMVEKFHYIKLKANLPQSLTEVSIKTNYVN